MRKLFCCMGFALILAPPAQAREVTEWFLPQLQAPEPVLAGSRVVWAATEGDCGTFSQVQCREYLVQWRKGRITFLSRLRQPRPTPGGFLSPFTTFSLAASRAIVGWARASYEDERGGPFIHSAEWGYTRLSGGNRRSKFCRILDECEPEAESAGVDVWGTRIAYPVFTRRRLGFAVRDVRRGGRTRLVRRAKTLQYSSRFRLAGRYIAYEFGRSLTQFIAVKNWQTGRLLYEFVAPIGAGYLEGFDLQPDGRLVVSYDQRLSGLGRPAFGWVSRRGRFHRIRRAVQVGPVFLRRNRIAVALARKSRDRVARLAVLSLRGRQLATKTIPVDRNTFVRLSDYDGYCLLWRVTHVVAPGRNTVHVDRAGRTAPRATACAGR